MFHPRSLYSNLSLYHDPIFHFYNRLYSTPPSLQFLSASITIKNHTPPFLTSYNPNPNPPQYGDIYGSWSAYAPHHGDGSTHTLRWSNAAAQNRLPGALLRTWVRTHMGVYDYESYKRMKNWIHDLNVRNLYRKKIIFFHAQRIDMTRCIDVVNSLGSIQ